MAVLNIYNQKAFAVLETTPGTIVFPSTKAESLILAGYISAERSISYTDSAEVRNSLNLKDQVKDKDAAGSLSVPIYARPGGLNIAAGAVDDAATWLSGDTTLHFDTLTGTINYPGIILVGTEQIFYTGVDFDSGSTTEGDLTGCVRGYNGTTAAAHADDATWETYDYITDPMGDIFFKSLMGEKMSWTAEIDASALTAVATTVTFENLSGDRPADFGVIDFDNGTSRELIYYTGISLEEGATAGSFTGCTRGYGGTTGLVGAQSDTLRIASPTYKQLISRPSFTLWYETDGIFFCCGGCTLSNLSHTAENKGYPNLELTGGFMTKLRAGKATIASSAGTSPVVYTLSDTNASKRFSVGMRVRCYDSSASTEYNNSLAGYTITAVDHDNNTVSIDIGADPITSIEAGVDYIQGYLPPDMEIGSTLKNEDTAIYLGGTAKRPTSASITIDAPIQYIDNEITPDAISEYIGNKRSITMSLTQLMQNSELETYQDAEDDVKQTFRIRWGDGTAGATILGYAPKNTVQVPTEAPSEPLVETSVELSALDTFSEDSFFIICV